MRTVNALGKCLFVILAGTFIPNGVECQTVSRENRELRMADQAIIASIAVSKSPKGRRLCSEYKLACVGPDKAELGLALIGARDTSASRLALVNLLSYRLDGSVAEDYSCYVLNAGRSIKRQLLEANSESLVARCRLELDRVTRSRKESFEGLEESVVCADAASIKMKAGQLADGITKGTRCGPEDF
jgi:hypothetical protein